MPARTVLIFEEDEMCLYCTRPARAYISKLGLDCIPHGVLGMNSQNAYMLMSKALRDPSES